MQRPITRGASAGTGLIFHVFAQDSTSTSGAGKASIGFGSWSCYYIRSGEAISGAITPQDITTIGTYAAPTANTNIRIKAVDNTNMIGIYEVQIHADWVNTTNTCQSITIYLTASGVAVLPIQIPLVAANMQDTVRLGLTALPNAAADAAGGLPISDAGGLDLDARLDAAISTRATPTNITAGTITTVTNLTNDPSGVTTLLSRLTALRAGYLDNLSAGAVALASQILDAAGIRTALGMASANLDTQIGLLATAATLATVATYIDTEVVAIKAKTDNLPTDPADASDIAALLSAISAYIDTEVAAILAAVDTEVAAILEDTGTTIPAQIAALNNLSAAQVNAEVVDALATDTYAEPGQGTPGATISLAAKIGYLYKFLRVKKTQTATTKSIFNDDGTTVDHKCTVADDGTTYSETEMTTGP